MFKTWCIQCVIFVLNHKTFIWLLFIFIIIVINTQHGVLCLNADDISFVNDWEQETCKCKFVGINLQECDYCLDQNEPVEKPVYRNPQVVIIIAFLVIYIIRRLWG